MPKRRPIIERQSANRDRRHCRSDDRRFDTLGDSALVGSKGVRCPVWSRRLPNRGCLDFNLRTECQ